MQNADSLQNICYPADRFVRILSLRGSAVHRGEWHGTLLGQDIRENIRGVLLSYATSAMGLTTSSIATIAGNLGASQAPELVELVAMAKAAEVDPDLLLAWNAFDDVWGGMACSSFAVWGKHTEDGRLWCGRNTDFPAAWAPHSAIVGVAAPESGVASLYPAFPGHLGGYGGMNGEGVAVLANMIEVLPGRGAAAGLPIKWIVSRILRECSDLSQAVALAQALPSAAGCSLLCAAVDSAGVAAAAVVEKVGDISAVRWPKEEWVVTANHFDTDRMCSYQPGAALGYSLPRCDVLQSRLEAGRPLTMVDLAELLATPPISMLFLGDERVTSVQSMIFDVSKRRAWVAQGMFPSAAGGFFPLSLMSLLRTTPGLSILPYDAARHGIMPGLARTNNPG